ncbi:hypothetical protein C4K10_5087 [Pseudomonas chlororaphis subsp. aureofaciens]|nr:hypothetical protein C4K14_5503 [Pseudomonas chlororaphis subsp. aureofaciens]AZD94716.1 hypothetical protein C4K13_5323 [Pseudomonas chlororaphis subsp. aureofaciens]AZE01042.1 hypothetical protein C4K12_5199 [Pseudomonas chlororaphis subsp. aureofaciens]AZE13343.1 hypothetical protein C4K10_5087 [Pseudomonas chlororaphis subsp. aureofaciens]
MPQACGGENGEPACEHKGCFSITHGRQRRGAGGTGGWPVSMAPL